MKVYIIRHGEGVYDSYEEFTQGVLLVPDKTPELNVLEKEWRELKSPLGPWNKFKNRKPDFLDWLVVEKKLPLVKYTETVPPHWPR